MTVRAMPLCLVCLRLQAKVGGGGVCTAFPAGIPQGIWLSEIDHRQPYPGDDALTFLPENAAAVRYATLLFPPPPLATLRLRLAELARNVTLRDDKGRYAGSVGSGQSSDAEHQVAYWRARLQSAHLGKEQISELKRDIEIATDHVDSLLQDEGEPWFSEKGYQTAQRHLEDLQAQYHTEVAKLGKVATQLQHNPVAARIGTLPPTVIKQDGVKVDHAMEAFFGRPLADHEIASLVGAQHGDLVEVHVQQGTIGLHLRNHADLYEAKRTIMWYGGQIGIHNDAFVVNDGGHGRGATIFAHQVRSAARLGVGLIRTTGGKGPTTLLGRKVDMNGYYTWPRLGYNARLSMNEAYDAGKAVGAPVATLHDLFRTPSGAAYWRDHGRQIDLTFDLSPGSADRQILKAYLDAKGIESTGVERMQQTTRWTDLDWDETDEAAANTAWAQVSLPPSSPEPTPAPDEDIPPSSPDNSQH